MFSETVWLARVPYSVDDCKK